MFEMEKRSLVEYLAANEAFCVIMSCVSDATYAMPLPSEPRSKT